MVSPIIEFQKAIRRLRMAKAELGKRAVVLQYKAPQSAKPVVRRRAVTGEPRIAAAR